jgi:putrescine aminotransferase
MAAVSATIAALRDERVPERADELGRTLLAGLRESVSAAVEEGVVREVRGAGLLIGIELTTPQSAGDLEYELVSRRVIPNHCLNEHGVVRLTPPALLDDDEVAWLLEAVEQSANAVARRRRAHARRR